VTAKDSHLLSKTDLCGFLKGAEDAGKIQRRGEDGGISSPVQPEAVQQPLIAVVFNLTNPERYLAIPRDAAGEVNRLASGRCFGSFAATDETP